MIDCSDRGSDPLQVTVALDANVLDPHGMDHGILVERFRGLMRAGLIAVVVPEGVRRELEHPQAPAASREPVPTRACASPKAPTARQHIARIRVRAILRGDAASHKHDADAAHLCDAAEMGCHYFLTQDKRFSRKRRDLEAALPSIRVLGLREFFERYDASEEADGDAS